MVEVENDGTVKAEFLCVFASALRHVAEKRLIRVFTRAAGDLKDHRGLGFDASLNDRLHLFHVVEVKRRNRVVAFVSLLEQFLRVHQTEFFVGYHSFVFR